MKLIMCVECGEFLTAMPLDARLLPTEEECPSCGGTRFKDTESGRVVDSAE